MNDIMHLDYEVIDGSNNEVEVTLMDLDKDNSISLVEFKEIYKKHSLEHERENN